MNPNPHPHPFNTPGVPVNTMKFLKTSLPTVELSNLAAPVPATNANKPLPPPPPPPPSANPPQYQYPQQPPPVPPVNPQGSSIKSFLGSAFKAAVTAATGFPMNQPGAPYGSPYGQPYAPPYPSPPNPNASVPGAPDPTQNSNGQIIVNGIPLDQDTVTRLRMFGLVVAPGRYWYDTRCGAWGCESGPCMGVIASGLALGGPLRADASGPSATGVFINGRQIHALDVMQLQAMGTVPIPGRWWVEADGRYGIEGSFIPLGNLRMQALASKRNGGYGSWSDSSGNFGGSDGAGFGYVGGTDSTGHSFSVSYG